MDVSRSDGTTESGIMDEKRELEPTVSRGQENRARPEAEEFDVEAQDVSLSAFNYDLERNVH
jgi:hypothetical protein